MKRIYFAIFAVLLVAAPAFATVTVTSPTNGETVGSSVKFTASATTNTCSRGVASMGIYANNNLKYTVNGRTLNTTISLPSGSYNVIVKEWDYCGGSTSTARSIKVSNQAGVSVSSPAANSTLGNPVPFVASATTGCAKGVASMGIYDNNKLVYTGNGAQLNKSLTLGGGSQYIVVKEWDNCGGSAGKALNIKVSGTTTADSTTASGSTSTSGSTLSGLQAHGGWLSWGELAPKYAVCTSCSGVKWSEVQHEKSVSLTGNGTRFNLGGTIPYSDALWSLKLIGSMSALGIKDSNHTLLPSLHNFTYDAYVYVTDLSVTQSVEFDLNMFLNGHGLEFGTQCDHLDHQDWDVWNNVKVKWVETGVPCALVNHAWNHVTIQLQRLSNNNLLYKSITLNGKTHVINITVAPFSVPSSWWGLNVNYQLDGNHTQASNTMYMDKFNVTYN